MLEKHKHSNKWYHPACVGIACPPDGDWLCQTCTNSQLKFLFLDSNVGPEGLEILDLEENESDDMYESEDDNSELDKEKKSRDKAILFKEDKDDEDFVPDNEDQNNSDSEPDFDSNSKSACASKKKGRLKGLLLFHLLNPRNLSKPMTMGYVDRQATANGFLVLQESSLNLHANNKMPKFV